MHLLHHVNNWQRLNLILMMRLNSLYPAPRVADSPPHCLSFREIQQIDGEAFLLLTQADIVKILSIKLGPALKIYNSILMLKNADEE